MLIEAKDEYLTPALVAARAARARQAVAVVQVPSGVEVEIQTGTL